VTQPDSLREGVHRAYNAIAELPQTEHPVPVGRAFAERLGYPAEMLDHYPIAAEAFAGVSNVSIFAQLPPGATVLDLGCGAGLDSFIAAERVGAEGQIIGVDFSESMLARASAQAAQQRLGAGRVEFKHGAAERIPLPDSSIDVALINGIFNLNQNRTQIFHELARVVKPQGVLFAAELILREPLPPEELANETDWFA